MAKYILATVLLFALALHAGCEQRVVRQKSYYPGQFSHVTPAKPPTSAGPDTEQTDILQDTWRGLSNLFRDRDSPRTQRQVLTAEELRALQQQSQ